MKPLVAVDVDDVLVEHHDALLAHINATFGSDVTATEWYTRYGGDIHAYGRAWGVRPRDLIAAVHDFLAGDDGFAEPLPGAVAALEVLRPHYRFVVISARYQLLREATETWLERHLAGVFEAVHLVGAREWGLGTTAHKLPTLERLGAVALIDDSVRHCRAAAEAGLRAILFGAYGWNREDGLPAAVERARDWPAVQSLLLP